MPTSSRIAMPAVDGWFTMTDPPKLIGGRCPACGTYVFPPRAGACPNPDCSSDELVATELSSRGPVWSYTENRYPPPPPFEASDPFEPYAIAAVELADEGLVVLGQVAKGVLAADLRIGMEMQLELDVLRRDDEHDYLVWAWAPAAPASGAA